MGLLRIMMPPKFQLLALLAFAVAMVFLENQIQKLEESRGKLGKYRSRTILIWLAEVSSVCSERLQVLKQRHLFKLINIC